MGALRRRTRTSSTAKSSSSGRRNSVRRPSRHPVVSVASPRLRLHAILPSTRPNSSPNGDSIGALELVEALDDVVIAFDMQKRGLLGCSYFVSREEKLCVMEDIPEIAHELSEKLKLEIQPTVVLISSRFEEWNSIGSSKSAQESSLLSADEAHPPLPYLLELRPKSEFSYNGALDKLAKTPIFYTQPPATAFWVPGEAESYGNDPFVSNIGFTNAQGTLLQLSSRLNMDNRVGIGCVGAVLSYLQRKRSSVYLPNDPEAQFTYPVNRIERFSLRGTMFIDTDTLSSLQIMQPESHPNVFNQGPGVSGAKESLSVYGLFHNLARTPQGKVQLRQNFLRPSLDLVEINGRLDFVSVFVRPENQLVTQKLSKSLSRIKNMKTIMAYLRKGINGGNKKIGGGFKSGVWASLLEFCYHNLDIVETLREVAGGGHLSLRTRLLEVLDRFQLQRIGKMVHDYVDLDLSVEQHRTVIKYGVNENLDKAKEMYDGMEVLLSEAARHVAAGLPQEIRVNVIFFPQLGFHITIPLEEESRQPAYTGEGWERRFATSDQAYFKDGTMRDLDEQVGDAYATVCDTEIEIAYDLAQRVLLDEKLLVDASELCGELDSLLALAHGAIQYKLTKPRMVEENVVDIRGGRHLLQEMTVASYVANDTLMFGRSGDQRSWTDEPSITILTGPNYSGKSVYLKQVALIVYMAHIGSFVAADSATIGLTDKILARISTRETVTKMQSAFVIDAQQIAQILNHCTYGSLIVIDEFGKGTDSSDGAGLAAGVFQHFMDMGAQCPKVLAATHYHEIFEQKVLQSIERIRFAHMEVLVDRKEMRKSGNDDREVTYLYNLKGGRSTVSYGAQCAAMNGVPKEIVQRAVELGDALAQGGDLIGLLAGITPDEAEDLQQAETTARRFLGVNLDDIADEVLIGLTGQCMQENDTAEESTVSRVS